MAMSKKKKIILISVLTTLLIGGGIFAYTVYAKRKNDSGGDSADSGESLFITQIQGWINYIKNQPNWIAEINKSADKEKALINASVWQWWLNHKDKLSDFGYSGKSIEEMYEIANSLKSNFKL